VRNHSILLFSILACACSGENPGGRKSDATGGAAAGSGGSGGSSVSSGGSAGTTSSGGTNANSGGTNAGGASAGGSGASAGTGEGGTGPEPMPLPCDDLPETTGTWEHITPPGTGPGVSSIAVDPLLPGVVYAGPVEQANVWGGPGHGLWKSTDCGANWEHVSTGENADKINGGSLVYILISPTNSDLIYTNSLYGGLGMYKSTNGGVDWSDVTPMGEGLPDFVMGEAIDPNDDQHLLMTFHDNCQAPHAAMCIGETTDGGESWRVFDGPSELGGWAEQSGLFFLGTEEWLLGAPSSGLFYTTDAGATWQKKMQGPGCHGFGQLVHTGDKYYLPCWGGVAESNDGIEWSTITGSPHAISLVLGGDTLYASFVVDGTGTPFWSAPVSNPTTWTPPDTGHTFNDGAFELAYDTHHKVLYAPSFHDGLYRVKTE
jgi:hypothetical protein